MLRGGSSHGVHPEGLHCMLGALTCGALSCLKVPVLENTVPNVKPLRLPSGVGSSLAAQCLLWPGFSLSVQLYLPTFYMCRTAAFLGFPPEKLGAVLVFPLTAAMELLFHINTLLTHTQSTYICLSFNRC